MMVHGAAKFTTGGACRSVKEFEILETIGEGTYGRVFKARDSVRGCTVALKQMHLLPKQSHLEGLPRSTLREINLLKQLQHPNIVELVEVAVGEDVGSRGRKTNRSTPEDGPSLFSGSSHVYLVFEYCESDLGEIIERRDSPLPPNQIKFILLQLLRALYHLHRNKIVHRDVKHSNILINRDGTAKLADFGLARSVRLPPEALTEGVVTLWYRAPELLLGCGTYDQGVDIWAAGCVFGGMLVNGAFLPGKAEAEQVRLMSAVLGTPTPETLRAFEELPGFKKFNLSKKAVAGALDEALKNESSSCIDLLKKMLTWNPAQRISARDALTHPYFAEPPPPQCERLLGAAAAEAASSAAIARLKESASSAYKVARKEPNEPHASQRQQDSSRESQWIATLVQAAAWRPHLD